jgi:hypothetical protein
MPYFARPVADERDALLTFLEVPRAAASCWKPAKPDRWQ